MDAHETRALRTFVTETQVAREALEAKGAFLDGNAATHLIKALEAFQAALDVENLLQVAEALHQDTNK